MKPRAALWALIAMYAAARVLQVFSGVPPSLAVVALHIIPAVLFALVHGATVYGRRGILTFIAICVVVGNIAENVGVATGFPYGRYYFTDVMGPKILHVPVLLGLAYIGMGYVSWTLARLLLGPKPRWPALLPVAAAAIMTTWDLSLDPVWSTVLRAWIWLDGGAYFGVPLTNFAGWLLTTWIIYQLFALLVPQAVVRDPQAPIAFYAVSGLGNFLLLIPLHRLPNTGGIAGACAVASVLMLGICAAARSRTR